MKQIKLTSVSLAKMSPSFTHTHFTIIHHCLSLYPVKGNSGFGASFTISAILD